MKSRARHTAVTIMAVCLILLMLVAALAAPADLDTTFDTDGVVTTDFFGSDDMAEAMALQPDGKIILGGATSNGISNQRFYVMRYTADGFLDPTFDGDGLMTDSFSADAVRAIAVQPDGKIVFVCNASVNGGSSDFGVARLNANGSFDTSFDGDGKLVSSISAGNDQVHDVAIQPDGKILVAGFAVPTTTVDFAVARYVGDLPPNRISNFDTDRQTDIAI